MLTTSGISHAVSLAWRAASQEAVRSSFECIEPAHLWIGLCSLEKLIEKAPEAFQAEVEAEAKALDSLLGESGVSPGLLRTTVRERLGQGRWQEASDRPRRISRSLASRAVFVRAQSGRHRGPLQILHLLAALMHDSSSPGSLILLERGADLERLTLAAKSASAQLHLSAVPAQQRSRAGDAKEENADPSGRAQDDARLEPFLRNLTALAAKGELIACSGREDEMLRLVQTLARETKNNPLILGEPGVGKTALVEGLAWRIANGREPKLAGAQIIELRLSEFVAGTKYRGELEERAERLLKLCVAQPDWILFIDEIHGLVSEHAAMDIGTLLKPALARGELHCIGATTWAEYQKRMESDAALTRRFQPLRLEEPSVERTQEILADSCRERFEKTHGVKILPEAIEAAVQLSARYIADRFLPDKAIDLLDESCARIAVPRLGAAAAESEQVVTREDVAATLSAWTGIPLARLTADEKSLVLGMADSLRERVIGQDHACAKVAEMIQRAHSGLRAPGRPIAVLMFIGSTGLGKTELAKATAEFLFGSDERALLRLDMSEYMEKHTVSRLIGSPPGYVGFAEEPQLTGPLRQRPHRVVLIDEIEKAHPDVLNVFLQLFDEGRLTDARGRVARGTEAIFICTSNAPPAKHAGFGAASANEQSDWSSALRGFMRPELVARFDAIIPFHSLELPQLSAIARRQIASLSGRLEARGNLLEPSDAAIAWLASTAMRKRGGARELRRLIEQAVEGELSRWLLREALAPGVKVMLDADPGGLRFSCVSPST